LDCWIGLDQVAAMPTIRRLAAQTGQILPGLALCVGVTAVAWLLQGVETRLFGRAWLEALVLAILLGAAIRTVWTPSAIWHAGIAFGVKTVLEVAVVLLGVTVDAQTILGAGAPLLAGIAGIVVAAIMTSYAIGRLFRLPRRMSLLIACGNAICGNSAIAAVAPVIGAEGEDVTASIAFTAVLGVAVVLGLPVIAGLLSLGHRAFGVFAGLTVYAVPQVLAATAPVSRLSAQVGTLVKLVRVLMLGPVVAVLSMLTLKDRDEAALAEGRPHRSRPPLRRLVPWFVIGFLLLVAARSAGWTPPALVVPASDLAGALTIVSMAALGLGVDLRALAGAGPRVTAVVTLSLAVLGALSFALVRGLGLV
jgi:uncharacterized integral membrane protein (TIGR00698 family)